MVAQIIIPVMIVTLIGIISYLIFKLVVFDFMCNRSINKTLLRYNIVKTQFQIIKEFYENKGEQISDKKISQLAKRYRQNEPEQFLAMYDTLPDKHKQ